MALNIRNPEAQRLAAELARQTGETKTEAVTKALRDRLARVRRERSSRVLKKAGNRLAYARGSESASSAYSNFQSRDRQGAVHKSLFQHPAKRRLADELEDIAKHCASLPLQDGRPADEILGYDRHGLPR